MRPQIYLNLSAKTENIIEEDLTTEAKQLLHAALGIGTESGELIDLIKKHVFQDRQTHRTEVMREVGDLLWYVAILMRVYDFTFEETFDVNIEKLTARYKGGEYNPIEATLRRANPFVTGHEQEREIDKRADATIRYDEGAGHD